MKLLLSLVLLLGVAPVVAGQIATLDEGSFTITQDGILIGRESFSIRSTPSIQGSLIQASGNIAQGEQRVTPVLRADQNGAAVSYQIDTRSGANPASSMRGQIVRGRFSATSQTDRSESRKEYVVSEGAIVLDDDVFHQYYFLVRRASSGTAAGSVAVIVPRRHLEINMRLDERGTEPVTIGNATLTARRFVLSEPGAGERTILADSEGRILRVTIAATGVTATRDAPPR